MRVSGKKKILYVDTPIEPPGGGQQSLLLILQGLDKSSPYFRPIVFIPNKCEFTKQLTNKNICYKIVRPLKLLSEIRKLNPEIIHCNSATTRYAFYTALVSKLLCIPFIWHVRAVESAGWRDRVIAKLSTRIIAISEAVKEKFSYVKVDKIRQIYNAVDTEVFKSGLDIEYLYNEFNIEKTKKVVGIFSRLDPWKGHRLFIDTARIVKGSLNKGIPLVYNLHKDVIFLVVGEGEESYKKQLFEYTEIHELKEDMIFTGFRKDIPELMNLCNVIVNTSIEPEAFGRTIIEAMACAKPVIATNMGGPKEIIEDKVDGFLLEPDAVSIAKTIIELLQNQNLRNKIGKKAREKVIEKFSVEMQIKEIEKLYREVLAHK
ncbi:MAG: glycosyltransferase family 4 protein [bacterium]|nr:glycosyltransferase family 4 protein [bacterium]